jgi:hypothetical protein
MELNKILPVVAHYVTHFGKIRTNVIHIKFASLEMYQ